MPNWDKLREDFPVTRKYSYLANAAIGPIPVTVYNEAVRFYHDIMYHSEHLWNDWVVKIQDTKDQYAKFIGADSGKDIAFTHSTSEGMNIIAHMLSKKGSVISNELEFPSSNLPWLNVNPNNVLFVQARDDNKILLEDILKKISQNSNAKTLVTSHIQYSTGFKQDLTTLGEIAKTNRLFLVVNATQSLGASYFSVNDYGIDFMVGTGHKWLLSSFGIGAFYIRRKYLEDLAFQPLFFGQSGQKKKESYLNNTKVDMSKDATKFEVGTPHFQSIFALNAALKYLSRIGIRNIERRLLKLTDYLIEKLRNLRLEILSPMEDKKYRSQIVLFKPKHDPVKLVEELEQKHKIVLSARGKGIRVSPHFYNNEDDIDKLFKVLKKLL
jgi:selenocysteine lyase/cysteine desulfurase